MAGGDKRRAHRQERAREAPTQPASAGDLRAACEPPTRRFVAQFLAARECELGDEPCVHKRVLLSIAELRSAYYSSAYYTTYNKIKTPAVAAGAIDAYRSAAARCSGVKAIDIVPRASAR